MIPSPHRPKKEPRTHVSVDVWLIAALLAFALLIQMSCDLPIFQAAPADFAFHPPLPIDQDTTAIDTTAPPLPPDTCAEYYPVTEPKFIVGYCYLAEAITTDIDIIVGTHSAHIPEGEWHLVAPAMDSLMQIYHPEWSYDVAIKDDADPRFLSYLIKGTDDKVPWVWSVQMRLNEYKVYLSPVPYAYNWVGSRPYEECLQLAYALPSVQYINTLNTAWDSLQYETYALAILDSCKAGGKLADWRFNLHPLAQWILDRYHDAGWDQTLHAPYAGSPGQALVADLRGRRASPALILLWLDAGYMVITDDDTPPVLSSRD